MVFAFGNQSGVRPASPFPTLFNWTYLEYIHSIPHVQLCEGNGSARRCRGPFIFSPRLYLDSLPPTALGWAYGLNKRVVAEYSSRQGSQIIGGAAQPLVEAAWHTTSAFAPPAAFPHFDPIARVLETQPLVGWQRRILETGAVAQAHLPAQSGVHGGNGEGGA